MWSHSGGWVPITPKTLASTSVYACVSVCVSLVIIFTSVWQVQVEPLPLSGRLFTWSQPVAVLFAAAAAADVVVVFGGKWQTRFAEQVQVCWTWTPTRTRTWTWTWPAAAAACLAGRPGIVWSNMSQDLFHPFFLAHQKTTTATATTATTTIITTTIITTTTVGTRTTATTTGIRPLNCFGPLSKLYSHVSIGSTEVVRFGARNGTTHADSKDSETDTPMGFALYLELI